MMVQSHFTSDQRYPYTFERQHDRMARKEPARQSPATYVTPPPSTDAAPAHAGYNATPRSYSHQVPTMTQAVSSGEVGEVQPWIYQLFPESYAEVPGAGYHGPVVDGPYVQAGGPENGLVYSQAGTTRPTLSSSPLHSHDERYHYSAPTSTRQEQPFYQPYEDPRPTHEYDRRTRLSPFSEYDSSSSEYDSRDRGSTPAFSDYSRSPQLSSHSRASTASSSPALGGMSPDLSAVAAPPTSNPSYSHLVATFAAPINKRRKSRRKLEPGEREKVHQLRKMGACTRCWGLKMKCDDGSPCHRCEKLGAGAQCVRVHFIDLDVFSKWLVDAYSRTMMHHVLRWTNAPARAITVSHEKSLGVTLQLSVYEFVPAFPDQQLYWYKDATGWQHMATTPFAMKRGLNTDVLEKYIQDHTYYYVENSFPGNPILSEIFAIAWKYSRPEENFLIRDVLQLWTATQLLAHGATLHPSSDALNISPVPSPSAPLANQTPLPRVLANQLDHLLERRVWQLEKQILSELQKRIFGRKREDWLKIFLSLVILMNALERDSWRLYYWVFHMEDGYAWRHPSTPERLIEKNNTLAGSLAAHFAAISKGLTPFALDWSSDQTLALIGHCEDPDSILGAIERIGRNLRSPDHALRTETVLSNYREGDERSLDFLYSSKIMVI